MARSKVSMDMIGAFIKSPFLKLHHSMLVLLLLFSNTVFGAFNFTNPEEQQPDFLPVDQAFIFKSEITPQGLKLQWDIEDGYYLYQSKIKLAADETATLGEVRYSDEGVEEEDPYFGITRVVYNALIAEVPVTLINAANEAEVKVTYQGCAVAGLCYPPQTKTILYIPSENSDFVKPAPSASAEPTNDSATSVETADATKMDAEDASSIFSFMREQTLATVVLIFFLLGLGLTFTPCVLPMIPIITSIVAGPGSKETSTSKSFALALSYVLGMALTYAALGLAMGLLGAGANMQAAMQSPAVLIVFSAVFIALACAMFGMYDLQLPAFLRDRLENTSRQLSGGKLASVFFIGALSALLVSPCVSAPLAGALLYINASGDAVLGFLSLLALGLGMGVPLILVAVGGARFLPSTGPWMNASKFVFGVLLLGVAIWLLGRLLPGPVSLGLWAVLILGISVYMGAFDAAKTGFQQLRKTLALALFLVSAIWLVGAFSGSGDPANPLQNLASSTSGPHASSSKLAFAKVHNLDQLNAALAEASNNNKPAFVDIYADWCISCIIMENEVFVLDDVSALMSKFALIKVDVTDNDEGNVALLKELELFGPPSYLLYDEHSKEHSDLRIVGEISKERFVERLQAALERS